MIGTLSHPFLDWLNNYGVRLLMPFSGRWFYGDALFIVDPFLWIVFGGAVMLADYEPARNAHVARRGTGCNGAAGIQPLVPFWARMAWLSGVAAWIAARMLVPETWRPRIAVAALAVAAVYIGAMIGGSRSPSGRCGRWRSSDAGR